MPLSVYPHSVVLSRDVLPEHIYSKDELDDAVGLARVRILQAFDRHRELARGKDRRTEYYIGGVGPDLEDLVLCIWAKMHGEESSLKPIVREDDVRAGLRTRDMKQIRRIASRLDHLLLRAAAETLYCDDRMSLWPDLAGTWYVQRSALDELWSSGRTHARRKFDRRNEHGQVRGQRIRRGRPAGASTSTANLSWVG